MSDSNIPNNASQIVDGTNGPENTLGDGDPAILVPGQEIEGEDPAKSLNKWHDFESQYSMAVEQSAVVEREKWGSQVEFLMSCIASAVGLGNIWRFPFIAGQNGGGAFLIPYLVVLTVIGRPLYMLELGLGQFVSGGPVKVWEMNPAFRGVGFGATIASFFCSTFYCVIMGWSLLYLYYSFMNPLPWNLEKWSSPFQPEIKLKNRDNPIETFFKKGHLGEPMSNHTDFMAGKGLDGPPVFNLAMALLAAWVLVWLVMIVGVSGSGKIAYFTALFPYVILLSLLIAGCTLSGAEVGIIYFFKPDFTKLIDGRTWFQAVGQCFFSLGITFGGCIMFSSFNDFHHKLGRDILIISLMDTFTSVLAGTCIFSLIGHLAEATNTTVKQIAENGGAGMAFVTFPAVLEAFGQYPGPQIFCFLFFFMIIVLAVGSANGLVGTTVTVICDAFPKWNRRIVVTSMCFGCFFLGLIYICPSGGHVIDIVDRHGSEMVVYVMAIFETVGIAWVYGLKNITNDFEFMLGSRIHLYWVICWSILPIILFSIFICYLATSEKRTDWPDIGLGCGWVLSTLCWSVLPIAFIRAIQTRKSSSFIKRLKASFFPSRRWGPKEPLVREAWRRWKKTKPVEYPWTTKFFKMIGLRSADDVAADPQSYWSIDIESEYQTSYIGLDSKESGLEVVPVTEQQPPATS